MTKMKIIVLMCLIIIFSAVSFAANIQLISPKDGESTNQDNNDYLFIFRYTNDTLSTMDCELLIDSKVVATQTAAKKDHDIALFSDTPYKEGMHYYEVKCLNDRSDIKLFSYDLSPPQVQSFRLAEPITCIANDTTDTQVSVSVTVIDIDKKLGTCKAIDDAGNYVIVDQDLKIIEISEEIIAKEVSPVIVEKIDTPVTPLKNEVTEVVNEVTKSNLSEETNIDATVEEIPIEESLNETSQVTEKTAETKNATIDIKKEETIKTPIKIQPVFVGISLIVLILAAIFAFYMFKKQNEVVIVK